MFHVTLRTRRVIRVDAICLERTYPSGSDRPPDCDLNGRIVRRALEEVRAMWGDRPTFVIPPDVRMVMDPRPHPRLPPIRCAAWLDSAPLQPGAFASELVALWFAGEATLPLSDWVQSSLRDLPWATQARDYDF